MRLKENLNKAVLRNNVIDWIEKVKQVDILVGIPTFNNEETIGYVVSKIGEGLKKYYADKKTAIFISDGGSLDNTRENAYAEKIPEGIERRVAIYRGIAGKGTSFRAVFECAMHLQAKAILVFDSDLRSITPEWIKLMTTPIIKQEFDFCLPYYRRHPFDGTITNMIVYPLTVAIFGTDVRQPIGGDFAFNLRMVAFWSSQQVWLTDVARFGIDIWMTLSAINADFRLAQIDLGTKVHNPKDPAEELGPMFFQVLSTMFYLMGIFEKNWRHDYQYKKVELIGDKPKSIFNNTIEISFKKLKREFVEGFDHFEPMYRQVLEAGTFRDLKHVVNHVKKANEFILNAELWSKILYDFMFTYQNWSRNRRRLVDIITPLYFGRIATFFKKIMNQNWEEVEKVIREQMSVFKKNREYLINKFDIWEA